MTVRSVTVLRLVTLAECIEPVGETYHHVACERIIPAVVDIVGGNAAVDIAALPEDIVGSQAECG